MNRFKFLSVTLLAFLLSSSIAFAGDFGWMEDFNMTAAADPSGFRARLEARFHVGELEIQTVLDNADHPADAYAMFRLGEMSRQPIRHVIEQYKKGKGKGWGNIARSLGIKPGSRNFHALKQGQDLYDGKSRDDGKRSGKATTKKSGKAKGKKTK